MDRYDQAMHEVAVIAYDHAPGFELSIPGEVLGNDLLADRYAVRLVAGERGVLHTSAGWRMAPDAGLSTLAAVDTVIVAGWRNELDPPPPPLLSALRDAHAGGVRIVSPWPLPDCSTVGGPQRIGATPTRSLAATRR
jgi:AraC family transcriptional activator FtrA